jgi:hypothetical protein
MRRNLPPGSAICPIATGAILRYRPGPGGRGPGAQVSSAEADALAACGAATSHVVGKLTLDVGDLLNKFDDRSPNFCIGNWHKCLGEIGTIRRGKMSLIDLREALSHEGYGIHR